MRIQIDTKKKTIAVEQAEAQELLDFIDKHGYVDYEIVSMPNHNAPHLAPITHFGTPSSSSKGLTSMINNLPFNDTYTTLTKNNLPDKTSGDWSQYKGTVNPNNPNSNE